MNAQCRFVLSMLGLQVGLQAGLLLQVRSGCGTPLSTPLVAVPITLKRSGQGAKAASGGDTAIMWTSNLDLADADACW